MESNTNPKAVLFIGGLDPSGGAGVCQDIQTSHILNIHPVVTITSNTIQNDSKFISHEPTNAQYLESQVNLMLSSYDVKSIKIGLLTSLDSVLAIYSCLNVKDFKHIKIILDTPLISTSGSKMVNKETIEAIAHYLVPISYLVTPNLTEYEYIKHCKYQNLLLKGGHSNNPDKAIDVLYKQNGEVVEFALNKIPNGTEVRGTGCRLASAIACFIAKGLTLEQSVNEAKALVHRSILNRYNLGGERSFLGKP